MFSYWERQSFVNYGHIVIGSGIVGLSTAIELKQEFPNKDVLVLERGLLLAGASTKNAGFACMGSVTELLDDLMTMSEDEVVALFEQRKKGLELLRTRLGDESIGYAANGSYELIRDEEKEALEKIEYLNKLLLPINKRPSFKPTNEKIATFGFNESGIKALIENTCEGELHTGKMMKALFAFATQQGVVVKTGAEVISYSEQQGNVVVGIKSLYDNELMQLSAKTVSICTNAFTKQLLPNENLQPGRGQVLVTKPIEGLKFKGVFHLNKGYYYFREVDGRVLIGGGRNEDFEGEQTDEFVVTENIQSKLEEKLNDIILPNTHYEVDMRWAGIMAFGNDKQPIIKQFSPRVFGAFRMGGMGVAIGSEAGRKLSEIISRSL